MCGLPCREFFFLLGLVCIFQLVFIQFISLLCNYNFCFLTILFFIFPICHYSFVLCLLLYYTFKFELTSQMHTYGIEYALKYQFNIKIMDFVLFHASFCAFKTQVEYILRFLYQFVSLWMLCLKSTVSLRYRKNRFSFPGWDW